MFFKSCRSSYEQAHYILNPAVIVACLLILPCKIALQWKDLIEEQPQSEMKDSDFSLLGVPSLVDMEIFKEQSNQCEQKPLKVQLILD